MLARFSRFSRVPRSSSLSNQKSSISIRRVLPRNLSCCSSARSFFTFSTDSANSRFVLKKRNKDVSKRYYGTPLDSVEVQFNLADVGEGIAECELLTWHIKEGQEIQQFDMICEVQSDKATAEITSPFDGLVTKLYHKVGDMAQVGQPLIDIKVAKGDAPQSKNSPSKKEEKPEQETETGENQQYQQLQTKTGPVKALATPAVRRMARENNIDLRQVLGSGKEGRILKHDIIAYLEGGRENTSSEKEQVQNVVVSEQETGERSSAPVYQLDDREVSIRGIKKAMVKSMTAACQVPHFGYCDEMLVNNLKELREEMKPIAAEKDIKLSYLPFLIKSCSLALKEYPDLNAHTNSDCSAYTVKGSHNIGIAMDTPNGLIVPNVKNVQDLSILEIAREINQLQMLGAAGKLEKKHLEGGTFTLSNVGAIGGTYASPVLFLPQVVIGAIGKIQTLPRFKENGEVYPANVVTMSWSADHRVVDGATVARFSNTMKTFVEKPNSMLLAMK